MIDGTKNDSESFIFTLKNPHGTSPSRYTRRVGYSCSITCDSSCGPLFGFTYDHYDGSYSYFFDICINDDCNKKNSCYIDNDGSLQYECHPEYKESLFVNTAGPDYTNYFTVLDYEVFTR